MIPVTVAPHHKTEYKERRNHYAFYSVNTPVDGFDTDRETFVGLYNEFADPERVVEGRPGNSIAHGWSPIASHYLDGTLRLLGLKTEAEDDAASEEDIRLMVENSGEQGAIAQEEQQWIENVFDFGDMVASDAMTPEPDVTAFSLEESTEDILGSGS